MENRHAYGTKTGPATGQAELTGRFTVKETAPRPLSHGVTFPNEIPGIVANPAARRAGASRRATGSDFLCFHYGKFLARPTESAKFPAMLASFRMVLLTGVLALTRVAAAQLQLGSEVLAANGFQELQ